MAIAFEFDDLKYKVEENISDQYRQSFEYRKDLILLNVLKYLKKCPSMREAYRLTLER